MMDYQLAQDILFKITKMHNIMYHVFLKICNHGVGNMVHDVI